MSGRQPPLSFSPSTRTGADDFAACEASNWASRCFLRQLPPRKYFMSSYLVIASKVLSEARQPLSATQILRAAYDLQIVPRDLYGKTQHKTLQARIAEDILHNRGQSEFVRTERGRFFLRSLLAEPSVSRRFKGEYLAPNRSDQLKRFYVACIRRSTLRRIQNSQGSFVPL